MNYEEKERFVNVMRKIIDKENLPQPKKILMRQPSKLKIIRSKGRCHKYSNKIGDSFNITISTMQNKFIPNVNGKWRDKINRDIRYSLCLIPAPFNDLLKTAAHEIAHLKFWKHNAQHHSYTEELYNKLLEEVKNDTG